MLRRAVILFVILGLAPGVWLRSLPLRPNHAQAVDSRADTFQSACGREEGIKPGWAHNPSL